MALLFRKNNAAPKQAASLQPDADVELERQAKLVNMQKTLEEMKQKIDLGYSKIDEKQAKVKDLIRQKKKNEAKRQLQVLKTFQEELAKQENMCIILEKTKIQLEVAAETTKLVDVMRDAVSLQKEAERNREFLDEFLIDQKEINERNKEIGNLLCVLADGEEEEQDELEKMYQELADEVNGDDLLKDTPKKGTQPQIDTRQKDVVQSMEESSSIDYLLSQGMLN